MFLIDNIDLFYESANYINEQEQEQPGQSLPPNVIEFENIKKIIVYEKIKQVHILLKKLLLINKNSDLRRYLIDVIDFIELIITYYDTINYIQATSLLNSLVQNISDVFGIQLPNLVEDPNPNLTMPSPDGNTPPPPPDGLDSDQLPDEEEE